MKRLTILWLDDMRDPYKYLNKKSNTGAFIRNKAFYDNLFANNDVNFIWVKNFAEFTEYILNNGLPQFVSFDHDLGKGEKKGLDCARWLVKYCRETNNKLPKFFAHSANNNGREQINRVLNGTISENKQHKTMKQIKTLTESELRKMITETVRRVLRESVIPSYEHPVYIDCTSHKDADVSIEIGYSSYSSSLFYVGECGTDCYAALEAVVKYLVENDIIDHYAYSEDELERYNIEDFIEVEGYYFPSWQLVIHTLVGNHGERRFH